MINNSIILGIHEADRSSLQSHTISRPVGNIFNGSFIKGTSVKL